jgi:DNA gyrase/topoisomerase IV subunit A
MTDEATSILRNSMSYTARQTLRERLSMEECAISEMLAILRTQKLSTERRYEILNDLTQRERVRKRILKILGSSNGC